MNGDPADSDSDNSSIPSRPPSPTAEAPPPTTPPTVADLITHFLAAKRSLSSASFVYRANELVTSSRALVEEIAVLNARNAYSTRGVEESVNVLVNIQSSIEKDGQVVGTQFQKLIERLDIANERLVRTLSDLQSVRIDHSLQSRRSEDQDSVDDDAEDEDTESKTLYTFIDPSKHEELQASLRKDIDDFYSSRADLEHTLSNLNDSLHTITTLVRHEPPDIPPDKSPLYNSTPLPVSDLFSTILDNAKAMASLLSNLVQHYDLTATALKHTEGGSEAARRAVQNDTVEEAGLEESLYHNPHPAPISDEERTEMLQVLANDAEEVEDVLSELRSLAAETEDLHAQLTSHSDTATQTQSRLLSILSMLHEMRQLHLPSHLHALQTFRQTFSRIEASIVDKTAELHDLAASNEGFLAGYAELLREKERRGSVRERMRMVAKKAERELRRLGDEDRVERERFLEEWGAFLPAGLWDEAGEGARLWEVREIG